MSFEIKGSTHNASASFMRDVHSHLMEMVEAVVSGELEIDYFSLSDQSSFDGRPEKSLHVVFKVNESGKTRTKRVEAGDARERELDQRVAEAKELTRIAQEKMKGAL